MSDHDTPDPRPRPAYGEYATPEQQRARIQQPDVAHSLDHGVAAPTAAPAPVPAPQPAPAPRYGGDLPGATRPAGPRPDRIITAILLGAGAVNVFLSVQGFLNLADAFARTMETMGIPGEFTNTAAAQTWGAIAAVVLIAGYLLTALAAWRRIRAGRISWWIPLVGAAISYALVLACLSVPLAGDPAFQEYVRSMS
ncbi:MAG: DUF6264 family protein [Microbacterium sp.]